MSLAWTLIEKLLFKRDPQLTRVQVSYVKIDQCSTKWQLSFSKLSHSPFHISRVAYPKQQSCTVFFVAEMFFSVTWNSPNWWKFKWSSQVSDRSRLFDFHLTHNLFIMLHGRRNCKDNISRNTAGRVWVQHVGRFLDGLQKLATLANLFGVDVLVARKIVVTVVPCNVTIRGAVSATPLFLFTSGDDKLNCLK